VPPTHSLRLGGAQIGVVWPPGAPAGVLVLLGDRARADTFAEELQTVVLCAAHPAEAELALAWAGDHAAELGAAGPIYIARDDSLPVRVA
jgi:hypothetical protein